MHIIVSWRQKFEIEKAKAIVFIQNSDQADHAVHADADYANAKDADADYADADYSYADF